jgi:hypothetical protein
MAFWNVLQEFGIFYHPLVHFVVIWYILARKIWQPCLRVGESVCSNGRVRNLFDWLQSKSLHFRLIVKGISTAHLCSYVTVSEMRIVFDLCGVFFHSICVTYEHRVCFSCYR